MAKYVLKRILLMILTFFVIVTICFMLIRLLPRELPMEENLREVMLARFEALGYNEPLLVQFGIYLKNIFTNWDFGTSWYVQFRADAWDVLMDRLWPTVLVNFYSFLVSVPLGLALGIYAAVRKNKWQDHLISTLVMVFVSVPSYVYGFLVQYFLYFKAGLFPLTVSSLADAGGSWFTWTMFYSMIPPIIALSFGQIAGLCRFTRAELTETLTSDYMLLARTKGLTRSQATTRHALKNAMVPILPMIISTFISILAGSMVIEQIFAIPGVGQLYIRSINLLDYDVFMMDTVFYVFVGLLAGIVVDISYGFIDPRIRMGKKK
ncbi:MAG TPA: ABC transporter permease [Candidatus Enterenecus stercoripullorum]|nr:ABC transporter permease [Candidatus Enterenecus stercoripullorum]